MKASTIIKKVGCQNLHLFEVNGKWCFLYRDENGDTKDIHGSWNSLSDMPACGWVSEGQDFVRRMEGRA